MEILERNIKVALVGDACVGKSNWVSMFLDDYVSDDYVPTINYQSRLRKFSSTIGVCTFDIWDISGSHSTPQDRAKWIEDSDAAIIIVDLANQDSINNTILWYREILSSQQHSNNPKHLPIIVFAYKAYEDDTKYKIKPTEISWPEEMGSTPFHYNEHRDTTNWETDETHFSAMLLADTSMRRPFGWILEQLTGQPEVGFQVHYPSGPGFWYPPRPGELEENQRQMDEACKLPMPEESDVEL
ncbi:hypothetical protein N7509_013214 [Penicillium cosmopolitanum]|uniref:Uncharacterized protein n=1 Tax=Penicillium cosmopolitanum TaxID=1131564 RepID=A0A9W9VBT7_9EURO|nr:uncharacterized protein N7509_013214 [Penicillium cosmopolitanum]KAJ5376328.1 hypothetical protein N7509_013214 [Penicillium cosmopolitanum]